MINGGILWLSENFMFLIQIFTLSDDVIEIYKYLLSFNTLKNILAFNIFSMIRINF